MNTAVLVADSRRGMPTGNSAPNISAEPDLSVRVHVMLGGTSRRSSASAGRVWRDVFVLEDRVDVGTVLELMVMDVGDLGSTHN